MSRPNSGTSSEHRSALADGTRLQNYAIERVLGSGGFGITYMAREDVTGRAVAIKEYLPSSLAVRVRDGQTVQPVSDTSRPDYEWGLTRFRQEAKLLLSLRHPNIVPSLSYFEGNGTAYLVMEYQDGQTLSGLMGGGVALEESEVREFLDGLLDGVEAVHKAGLLHRDIKPDNIFVRKDGTPVLIDFGSARQALGHHSHSLTAVVTDGYAPFEQYERGGDQGPWTDIYAVGAVLLRCLVGHRPPTATKRLSAQYRGTPDPAAQSFATLRQRASRPLANAIEASLAVNAEDRPQSVADLRALIADTGARGTVRRPEASPTLVAGTRDHGAREGTRAAGTRHSHSESLLLQEEPPRRRRMLPIYAALAVLLLGGGAAAAYFGVGGISIPGFTADTANQEAKRLADEAEKRKSEEARLAAEAEARRKAEDEAKRKGEDEAKRRADDDAKRKAEEDAQRRADEAKRRADDEKRKAEEEAKRTDDEKKRAEEIARRRADEERARRDEERRRAEEEDNRRRADAEARRKTEEEARRKSEEEAKRRADEERARADQAARPSYYLANTNRGAVYFAFRGATLEAGATAALNNLVADVRSSPNYRIALLAGSGRNEGNGAEGTRLRQQRLDAVRVWLVARGIDGDRIRAGQVQPRGDGADQRFVTIVLEQQTASTDRPNGPDRPGTDRPGTDRPGTDRPGTDRTPPPDSAPRYTRDELTRLMFRLIKGEAYEPGRMQNGTEGAISGGDGVSATAVCINWEQTTPQKAVVPGAYSWTARSASLLGERALAGCRAMGRGGCVCQVLEVGSGPALAIPESFMQRYAR